MKHLYKVLPRELRLLLISPKEYLFSYTYPRNSKIRLNSFNPICYTVGKKLISQIHSLFPDLQIHFIGSSALKIMGSGDIDLMLESPLRDFKRYLPILSSKFGPPIKIRHKFIEWKILQKGHNVDLCLIDPASYEFKTRLKVFEVLQADKNILAKYQKLMLELNGLSEREYVKRKLEFFNDLIF